MEDETLMLLNVGARLIDTSSTISKDLRKQIDRISKNTNIDINVKINTDEAKKEFQKFFRYLSSPNIKQEDYGKLFSQFLSTLSSESSSVSDCVNKLKELNTEAEKLTSLNFNNFDKINRINDLKKELENFNLKNKIEYISKNKKTGKIEKNVSEISEAEEIWSILKH